MRQAPQRVIHAYLIFHGSPPGIEPKLKGWSVRCLRRIEMAGRDVLISKWSIGQEIPTLDLARELIPGGYLCSPPKDRTYANLQEVWRREDPGRN